MLPREYFRFFHFAHHRFTQNPARDPELAQPRPSSVASYLWHVSGLPYWYDRLSVTLRHALTGRAMESFIPPAQSALIVREARILWGRSYRRPSLRSSCAKRASCGAVIFAC